PCPDVFQFPLFSAQFGRELREEAELRGGWAEHHEVLSWAVPLSALQLDSVLQGALRELLPPIARRLFPGYAPKGRTVLSSVVRYDPAPSGHAPSGPSPSAPARPSATISLSVSLSPAHGGGWLFPRYGCVARAPPGLGPAAPRAPDAPGTRGEPRPRRQVRAGAADGPLSVPRLGTSGTSRDTGDVWESAVASCSSRTPECPQRVTRGHRWGHRR
ncbi:procollagen-lysine,2-oxoglutarate 5-dioxygenase 2-like, partial [Haemorhous mexicanus]|uniref:procollagen-lysine,2-oxoglutarate 5-dioxygenase 2-like n=1 Tax=Haemorhous mexicanus TaxID=30427 RepID=UPI0028BDA69A